MTGGGHLGDKLPARPATLRPNIHRCTVGPPVSMINIAASPHARPWDTRGFNFCPLLFGKHWSFLVAFSLRFVADHKIGVAARRRICIPSVLHGHHHHQHHHRLFSPPHGSNDLACWLSRYVGINGSSSDRLDRNSLPIYLSPCLPASWLAFRSQSNSRRRTAAFFDEDGSLSRLIHSARTKAMDT